jgi:SAM-dependent methyltransferase
VVCDAAFGLPFRSNVFDIASVRYALHDIEDKPALLQELCRVASLGARIQITDMCVNGAASLHFYNTVHTWKTRGNPQTCWIVDESTYDQLFKEQGMRVISKSWYDSAVSSRDWLREGQVTLRRHQYLLRLVRDAIECDPGLVEAFQLDCFRESFRASFPVLVLTAEVQ